MKPATKKQIGAINAILVKRGMKEQKAEIIAEYTCGRTDHSSELYFDEAHALLQFLIDKNQNSGMLRKLFAMAIEMGWCPLQTEVLENGTLKKGRNYSSVHTWVVKSGYLHKPLRQYSYQEMPKLVTQFEIGPYKHYLNKI